MALTDDTPWDADITDGTTTVRFLAAGHRPESLRRIARGQGVEQKEISQSSWVGGRGATVLSADPDKFSDSYNAWTHNPGQFTPGPLVRWASIKNETANKYHHSANWPGEGVHQQYRYRTVALAQGQYLAVKKLDQWDTDIGPHFRVNFLARGDVTSLTVYIYSDVAGAPGAAVLTSTITVNTGESSVISYCSACFSGTCGANQWIVFYQASGASTIIAGDTDVTVSSVRNNGASWLAEYPAYYVVTPETYAATLYVRREGDYRVRFFEHLEGLYALRKSNLYLNGDRGKVTLSAADTATVTSPNGWTTNCFRGCVLKLVDGSAYIIIGNNTVGGLTLDRTTKESGDYNYVILGSERFMHIGTMTGPATDAAVCNNGVYLAHGDSVDVEKLKWDTATYTHTLATDAASRAYYLRACVRAGKVRLYRAYSNRKKYSYAEPGTDIFAAALTWNADQPITNDEARAQGLLDYDGAIWVPTESDVYSIQDTGAGDVSVKRPGPSERAIIDDSNGKGASWWNTNLYFGYMDGFMRLYGRTVDDIGPNRDDGLPLSRRGIVISSQPIFGFMAAAVSGYRSEGWISTLMATPAPGGAWHEIFRGIDSDYSIDNLYYQNIPLLSNRLWFAHGGNPCYATMPNTAQNPLNDTPATTVLPSNTYPGMLYSPGAMLKTAWIDWDAPEREKDWTELRVYSENLGAYPYGTVKPSLTIWPTTATGLVDVTVAPYSTQALDVRGNRGQLQWVLEAGDARVPPVLRSFTLRAVQMNEVRYDVLLDFEAANLMELQAFGADAIDANDQPVNIINILDSWQEKSTRLTLTTKHPAMAQLKGHVEPVPWTGASWKAEETKLTGQIMFRSV